MVPAGRSLRLDKDLLNNVSAQVMPGPYERASFQVRLLPFVTKKFKEILRDAEDCLLVTGASGGTRIPKSKHP